MVNRNAGSGTRILIDRLLKGARPGGYWAQPKSHGAVAVAVGCSLLILAWHMPSDVLGGYLLAALCVSLAVAAMGRGWDEPGPVPWIRPDRRADR